MSSDDNDSGTLSPDDAFAVLGNETRMEILRTLGDAGDPLSFSTLRDRVGMRDSGQFNYHLDKLKGHFVTRTGEGYELQQAGRRVIETVLSGAVTEDPVVEPAAIDEPCPICGASTLIAFHRERLGHYCRECAGYYGTTRPLATADAVTGDAAETPEYGHLGSVQFPPAGIQRRTPEQMFRAATTWFLLEVLATANRVCPRCSAPLATSISVCEDHDATDGVCDECAHRHAVLSEWCCTTCPYEREGAFGLTLVTNTDLLLFVLAHGANPVASSVRPADFEAITDYDEEVLSVDPFEARFVFSLGDEALGLTVDEGLNVVDVTRS